MSYYKCDKKSICTIDNYLENEELGVAFPSDFKMISRSKINKYESRIA